MSRSSNTSVALSVAARSIHNVFTNPALILPSLIFPLFFFTAFAGGLSRVESIPGFDYSGGYTAFQFVFVLLFLSSNALPRNLIETDWFRTIATYNPVSYLIEAIRSLLITGWDAEALALGFGCAIALATVGVWACSRALRTRMLRT